MGRALTATVALALLVTLPVLSENVLAERRDERPVIKGKGDSGELGKEIDSLFGDIFGGEESEPVLSRYEPSDHDYSQIDRERERSLGIFRSTASSRRRNSRPSAKLSLISSGFSHCSSAWMVE